MKLFFVLLFLNLFVGCNDIDLMATESSSSESSESSANSNLSSIEEDFLEDLLDDFNALETRVDNIENQMDENQSIPAHFCRFFQIFDNSWKFFEIPINFHQIDQQNHLY